MCSLSVSPYNRERVDRAPVDFYVASNMPYPYPLKLGKPAHVDHTIRNSCETFIMDSGIGDDDVTNADVLDFAVEYDADYVVAKDYLHDREATTASVREFLDLYDSHACDSTPLIPLQPPHHIHYHDLPGFDAYVLGGMAGEETSPTEAVSYCRSFRSVVGDDPYVHALGVGGSMTVVRAVAAEPGLVDSIDCSTPEQAAKNGNVLDMNLKHRNIAIMTGEGSSRGRYELARTNAYQIADAYTNAARDTDQTRATDWVAQSVGGDDA